MSSSVFNFNWGMIIMFIITSDTIKYRIHNTLYNAKQSLRGKHLPRIMALEMVWTVVKVILFTHFLWQEEMVVMQDARWEKVT